MRHTIHIEQCGADANGKMTSCRSHLITLSNQAAIDRVVDYILRMEWLDKLVSVDDILVYDDDLD